MIKKYEIYSDIKKKPKIALMAKIFILFIFVIFFCFTFTSAILLKMFNDNQSKYMSWTYIIGSIMAFVFFIQIIVSDTKKPIQIMLFSLIFYLSMYFAFSFPLGLLYFQDDNIGRHIEYNNDDLVEILKKGLNGFFNYPSKYDKVDTTLNLIEMNIQFKNDLSKIYSKANIDESLDAICNDIMKKDMNNEQYFKYYEHISKLIDKISKLDINEDRKKQLLYQIKLSLEKEKPYLYWLSLSQFLFSRIWDWMMLSTIMIFLTNYVNRDDDKEKTIKRILNIFRRLPIRFNKIEREIKKINLEPLRKEKINDEVNIAIEELDNNFYKIEEKIDIICNNSSEIMLKNTQSQEDTNNKLNIIIKELNNYKNYKINDTISLENKVISKNVDFIREKLLRAIKDVKKLEDMDYIVGNVNRIAYEAKMLALNVSIQSNQIDKNNKTISVIAEEFGKLSEKLYETGKDLERAVSNSHKSSNNLYMDLENVIDLINSYKEDTKDQI